MSLIKGRGNKQTEEVLLALLKRNKLTSWRRHLALPGKPDFAFAGGPSRQVSVPMQKVAVFVDGWLMAFASPQTVPPLWGYLR